MKYLTALLIALSSFRAMPQSPSKSELEKTILRLDSLFWEAYNKCDVETMGSFFTDDLEFYHDKGGLTNTRAALIEGTKKGLCGNPNWRLRREAVAGTVSVYSLDGYGAILTGEHYFYVNESGKPEYRDGLAKFTHVWRFKNNEWKMHRVLSYDHGPAPSINTRKTITVDYDVLKQYVGKYKSAKAGVMTVSSEANSLQLRAGDFMVVLHPEEEDLFFVKERDLQFRFVRNKSNDFKIVVIEHGKEIEEAPRVD